LYLKKVWDYITVKKSPPKPFIKHLLLTEEELYINAGTSKFGKDDILSFLSPCFPGEGEHKLEEKTI